MSNLQTRYAISSRLIAWGDELDQQRLSDILGLDDSSKSSEKKGELIRTSGSSRTRTAKTGLLSLSFGDKYNDFDPVAQLNAVSEKLAGLNKESLGECGVERCELQVSLYYEKENPAEAEPDFLTPNTLHAALATTGIRLRVTVMP